MSGTRHFEKRKTSGFTMMELMIVIAIIGISMAVVFVSVFQIQKSMQQKELDETAKEVFIAAQNHLSSAKAKGFFDRKSSDIEMGFADSADPDIRYYVVGSGSDLIYPFKSSNYTPYQLLDRVNDVHYDSALYQMLPFGSIDDTVRLGDTYVVRYNAKTANVLDVFLAHPNSTVPFSASTSGFSFSKNDYSSLMSTYRGEAAKQARQSFGTSKAMIGWYGGDGLNTNNVNRLEAPILDVENGACLLATITDPNAAKRVELKLSLKLIVIGEKSNAIKEFTLVDKGSAVANTNQTWQDGSQFKVCLDDVTRAGCHFTEVFGSAFIPGENLKIQVVEFSTNSLANVAESGIAYRNSLFASLVKASNTNSTDHIYDTAKVSNIRHLENISNNVSGFNPLETNDWGVSGGPTTFIQTSDMSWTQFQDAVVEMTYIDANKNDDETKQARADAAAKVQVLERTGGTSPVKEGSFMPVTPFTTSNAAFKFVYKGADRGPTAPHKISDVVINKAAGNVGLFADLTNGSVSDVVLANFKVNGDAGYAGALAGSTTGATIERVLAYNELDSAGKFGGADTDAAYEIVGSSGAGGLVGNMQGGSITQSAAALYVRSSGGPAGGFVGDVVGGDAGASITQSYSGGHTHSDTDDSDGKTEYGVYLNETSAGVAGRINVYSVSGVAGGFVGNATNLNTESCYSACSAKGATYAGGFVGVAANGSIKSCYSTGLVVVDVNDDGVIKTDTTKAGSFVGLSSSDSRVDISSSNYLDLINYNQKIKGDQKMKGVAGEKDDPDGLSAIDASTDTYHNFMSSLTADAIVTSSPYDKALETVYGTKFPFKTIVALAGLTGIQPSHLGIHYGDWPSPETLVVNEGGSGGGEGGDDGPRDVVVVGGTDDLEAGDYFDLQLTSSSGRTFSLNKDFSWGFDVTSNPDIVVFDRNTNDVGLYFTESGTTTITLTAKEDLYKDGVMYFQQGTTMQITVTGLVRDLRGSYSDLARTYSQNGVQHYSVTFTNNTSRKVQAIVVRMKADGNITEIGGNVTGVVSDGYATITFDNYGNGISAGVTKEKIQMIVKGEGDFGLS